MPSNYAHYRFGMGLLSTLPADVRKTVQRFQRLFEMGLYGPDIFYYASPFQNEDTGFLGIKYHEQTGKAFFQRVCRSLRMEPSEAGQAYLYGVLCHYCLDAVCHPYILESAAWGTQEHARMETEFDRYLLELDGKLPAHCHDLSGTVSLTEGECATVAQFYSSAKTAQVRRCVRNMAFFLKLLATPSGIRRNVLKGGLSLVGKDFSGLLMAEKPEPSCAFTNEALMRLYTEAEEKFSQLLEQLREHLQYNAPLGEAFLAKFCD